MFFETLVNRFSDVCFRDKMFYFFLIDFDVLSPDMTYEIADWLLFVRYLIFFLNKIYI